MSKIRCPQPAQNGWYLLFWPVFGIRYLLLEQCHPAKGYHPVHCFLDDRIPFLEGFLIPYLLWHICVMGVHLWLYLRNDPAFRGYSRYLILSMSLSTAAFLLYPSCQNLRPEVFPRENFLTEMVRLLYRMDTSTNVCPSEHVIGSAGFFLAVRYSQKGSAPGWVLLSGIIALLTASATVFLKQHSVIDVAAALPISLVAWNAAFYEPSLEKNGLQHRIRHSSGQSSA